MGMSPVRRAFFLLFCAAAIVAVGLLVAQDQVVLQVRSAVPAEEPDHASYVAALVGAGLSNGNGFDVLTDGDEIFAAMLTAIDGSTRRISFETYIYDTGHVAARFTDAFERAARRGVVVNIVVDAVGASGMAREHVSRLRDAGARLVRFNPAQWYRLEEMNYRTHRKILVVDGELAFTGGVSIADHWIGRVEDKRRWRDTHVAIRGPLVRGMEGAFYENFLQSEGVHETEDLGIPVLDPAPPHAGDDGAALLVRSSSTGGANELKMLYLLSLASARRTIDVASPYFLTDSSTMWSLEDARRRGVRVRVLLESEKTDAMPVKYASRHAYDHLLQQGIELYEYQPTMMHAKVLVVDGVWSMFGSANFDNRSMELNEELNVAVSSRRVAERFLADFETNLTRSERITLEAWRARPLLEKVREGFWVWFGEVF
ncbi:phospholipase D-like domain-containing protein [soil metagenome]